MKKALQSIESSTDPEFYRDQYKSALVAFKEAGRYLGSVDEYFVNFCQFDVRGDLVKRCFDVNDIKRGVTIQKMILKYGDIEGARRWINYCEFQAKKNTKQYKMAERGMSSEQVDEYNRSRAVTSANMVSRYGEIEGNRRWNEYVARQRYAGSSEAYFIEKYGEEHGQNMWARVNRMKTHSLEVYVEKYGEVDGPVRYEQMCAARPCNFYSPVSQKVFWQLWDNLPENLQLECKFAEHGGEFGKLTDRLYAYYDFVIPSLKYCIEFNGDCFHANPQTYGPDDTPNPFNRSLSSSMIWEMDAHKNGFLQSCGFIVDVVWESSYNIDDLNRRINDVRKMHSVGA